MLRGVLIFRGAPDIQRGPDAQRGPVFWWTLFLSRPKWSEGPRLSGRAFLVGSRTYFVTSVWVLDTFAGVLAPPAFGPQGPENPKAAPLPPPPPSCVRPWLAQRFNTPPPPPEYRSL